MSIRVLPEAVIVRNLADAPRDASKVVLSPSGKAAAIMYIDTPAVRIVAGLPGSPQTIGVVDLATLGCIPNRIAVSDDGARLLASCPADPRIRVHVIVPGGQIRLLPVELAVFAFLNDSQEAIAVNGDTRELVQLSNLTADFAARSAGVLPGEWTPSELAMSKDNRTAFATSMEGFVALVSLVSSAVHSLSCTCVPSTLERLAGNAVFRLTGVAPDEPVWIVDAETELPRTLFIPVKL